MKLNRLLTVGVALATFALPISACSQDKPTPLTNDQNQSATVLIKLTDLPAGWQESGAVKAFTDGRTPESSAIANCLGTPDDEPDKSFVTGPTMSFENGGPVVNGVQQALTVSSGAGSSDNADQPRATYDVTATQKGRDCYQKISEPQFTASYKEQYSNVDRVSVTVAPIPGLETVQRGYAFRTTAIAQLNDGKSITQYYDSFGIYSDRAYATLNTTADLNPPPADLEKALLGTLRTRIDQLGATLNGTTTTN